MNQPKCETYLHIPVDHVDSRRLRRTPSDDCELAPSSHAEGLEQHQQEHCAIAEDADASEVVTLDRVHECRSISVRYSCSVFYIELVCLLKPKFLTINDSYHHITTFRSFHVKVHGENLRCKTYHRAPIIRICTVSKRLEDLLLLLYQGLFILLPSLHAPH